MNLKDICRKIIYNNKFEFAIMLVIIANSICIGIETYGRYEWLNSVNLITLIIFTIEIIIRFYASKSIIKFFKDGWNLLDLLLVLVSYIPEDLFIDAEQIMLLRLLRVFRILRMLRVSQEIKTIISVFIKSLKSLAYNIVFMLIFMYLFSVTGVYLFKLDAKQMNTDKYKMFVKEKCWEDEQPYSTLMTSMYTAFSIMVGDVFFSDIRADLKDASKLGLIKASPFVITAFHIVWFFFSAFMILNLILATIVDKFKNVNDEIKQKYIFEFDKIIFDKFENEKVDIEEILVIKNIGKQIGLSDTEIVKQLHRKLNDTNYFQNLIRKSINNGLLADEDYKIIKRISKICGFYESEIIMFIRNELNNYSWTTYDLK